MSVTAEIREQGRGMAGALLVLGISFAYTIETWWLAVEVSATQLVGFVVVGLALVIPITRRVGFRSESMDEDEEVSEEGSEGGEAGEEDEAESPVPSARSPMWVESLEAVFQAFFVAYVTVFLFGIVSLEDPLPVIVRVGLVQVVPLAFGAAIANEFLGGEQEMMVEAEFPKSLAVFAMGAVFFAAPIAPTEEVVVLAAAASWTRLGGVIVATLVGSYLILYVLEFRGQTGRLSGLSQWRQIGQTCMVYSVGMAVAAGMLAALTETGGEPLTTELSRTIVLTFPAAIGASAARVVLA